MKSSRKKSQRKSQQSSSHKKSTSSYDQSSVTKSKLIDFLLKSGELQRKLQIIKQMLCQQQSFTPATLFHRLDFVRKGHITEKDISDFLKDNKVEYKGSELKLLYGKINTHQNDGGVNLQQFQNFILPNQNPRLRFYTMRRPIYIPLPHEKLLEKIQWLVSKLFTEIILEKSKLMEFNSTLISSFDFNAEEIFRLLWNQDQGCITGESLNRWLCDNNASPSIEEIGCIIRLIDKKGEGRAHLSDFKYYLATLGLKKQHQIFDQLSPIPALKNFQNSQISIIKDRDGTLYQRYLDNKSYEIRFDKAELARSRKSTALSRSRRNY